jgi:hypothetical protein
MEKCIMSTNDIREEATRIVQTLPANSSWDDLMHEIYVRQSIEAGLADSREGKTVSVGELRERFGLPR